jgi:KDO2-lipid IV(A) lauroyltransferase
VVKHLRKGDVVALPFDQNVRRSFAVFVDFFGKEAATTRALGLAALASEAPILIGSLCYLGKDRYRVEWEECPMSDVYAAEHLSSDEKQRAIAQRVSDAYAAMIRKNPSAWFWMHRRWKTTSREDIPEDFYTEDRSLSR